jgi:hypothetical protein
MKPLTEEPFERIMKFFTPELFLRFNSSDDEEADHADEAWEAAIRAYRHHLDGLRDQMPSQVKQLASLCLHDAEILACEEQVEPLFPFVASEKLACWSGFAILSVRQGSEIISLFYFLWDRIRKHEATEAWPFSPRRKHWLYDEVDVSPTHRGTFVHRVLFSDGSIMEIPFFSNLIHSFPLEERQARDECRQIA